MENECEALPGVAYPGVRDNCSALNTKTGYDDDDDLVFGSFESVQMSHIVESCPLTKLDGGLSRLHSADDDAVSWLTSYGS